MASISSGILCDFAQVRENLLFVSSGGVSRAVRPELPGALGVMLALVVEIPFDERDLVHEIEIVIKHNDAASDLARMVAAVKAEGVLHPGESLLVPAVADLRSVPVGAYGGYDVRMKVDGHEGPLLTFYVVGQLPTPA